MPSENAKDPYEEKAIANARNENISSEDIQKALETRKNWIADELELKNRDFRILKYGGVDFLLDL
jgi:hypothetical protein